MRHPYLQAAAWLLALATVAIAAVLVGGALNPEAAPVPVCTDAIAEAGGICTGTPAWELEACVAEDAPGPCVWDASTQGNGRGRSFWVDAAGDVHYLTIPSPITR